MQTRVPLTCAFVALSTLTAGCPSKKDTPEAAKPSGQISTATPTDDVTEAINYFGETPYYVCDLGSHNAHSGFKGNHLKIDDEVLLGRSDQGLTLKLGNKQIDVAPSTGGKELKGDSDFEHDPDPPGPPQQLKHQVIVVKITDYELKDSGSGCVLNDPNRPIIDIKFCPEEDGGWNCKQPEPSEQSGKSVVHQGDVHAQPK